MPTVQLGIERLVTEKISLIKNRRIGVVCHPASIDSQLRHTLDLLVNAGAQISIIFGPEHGARGEAQDMEGVDESFDTRLHVPERSLYGATYESLRPKASDLQGLDALVIDLQDIGTRYYTFVWTMALCMQAAGEVGLPVIICDRPNPIGGTLTEGNILDPKFSSFVGLYSVPNRHGMTPAEIAQYLLQTQQISCEVELVTMQGWQRSMYFDETGLPWVYPSPNMPTLDTALVYTGMCLVEATNLSEGRGCCRPFEVSGAPKIDSYKLAAALEAEQLSGCRFRPLSFRPMFHKHAHQTCGGVQIYVTDRHSFCSYETGIAFLKNVRALFPEVFSWRDKPYEFVEEIPAIDLLAGDDKIRPMIEANASLQEIRATWREQREAFEALRQPALLYR